MGLQLSVVSAPILMLLVKGLRFADRSVEQRANGTINQSKFSEKIKPAITQKMSEILIDYFLKDNMMYFFITKTCSKGF